MFGLTSLVVVRDAIRLIVEEHDIENFVGEFNKAFEDLREQLNKQEGLVKQHQNSIDVLKNKNGIRDLN
jgi:hypothetical protein